MKGKVLKLSIVMLLLIGTIGSLIVIKTLNADTYLGSRFSSVWSRVSSDPYLEYPKTKVTVRSFWAWGVNKLFQSAVRTLNDRSDLLPYFDKLVHPTGICLKGTWNITEQNPYTGYFQKGSTGLIIGRASIALSYAPRGKFRGFGLAGKIYPTDDPDHEYNLETGNFFVIDDLAGTKADYYTEVSLTNQPDITIRFNDIFISGVAINAAVDFARADTSPTIRQLYEISELGMDDPSLAITPAWMKIKARDGQEKILALDFRDELNLNNYPDGKLYFDIYVTSTNSTVQIKEWLKIGYIEFDDSTVSESCDHCLHFHHPKYKEIRN
jgi:hypothetical protein